MKKTLLVIALLSAFFAVKAQPIITEFSYPSSVNLFQLFEISFKLGPYLNPYDPDTISVYAIFSGPNNRCDSVIGFYYEGYNFQEKYGYEVATRQQSRDAIGWRIRYTPDTIGTWYFCVHAIDRNGETVLCSSKEIPYTFSCLSVSNAKGFITKANSRYLKREVIKNHHRYFSSFFPVGPNIAWYSCVGEDLSRPKGIYDYQEHIDSLVGNGNYMRIWLNRYQSLNLYGLEYTEVPPKTFFDTILNQKDAAELDTIINYASQNDIALMLCFFTYGDFCYRDYDDPQDACCWELNPYNTLISVPSHFFQDESARRVAKNLIRYIVARWGYATNIVSWELWNEVTNTSTRLLSSEEIFVWHKIMSDYIREIDPFHHCISTSMNKYETYADLFSELYMYLDFVQKHDYQNINKAKSKEQFSYILLNLCNEAHSEYPDKPFLIGEFGFGNGSLYNSKDPYGIDLHNSLWSSLFSSSMGPGSFWFWNYLFSDPTSSGGPWLINRYGPVLTFCQNLPILSDSFEAFTTGEVVENSLVFDNSIETYYMKNITEDTIFGWSQDTAFAYQSLRWLTDSVRPRSDITGDALHFVETAVFDTNGYVYTLDPLKRPHPSSNSNLIKITFSNVPGGTQYEVHWFNSETGLEYNNSTTYSVVQDVMGEKYIHISFPSFIRDLNANTINNVFGDVVFAIYRSSTNENSEKRNN